MYVAIDIGGTNTRILITEDLNNPDFKSVQYIHTEQVYGDALNMMFKELSGVQEIRAIAVGFAGGIDAETQRVDGSNALPDWHGKSLGEDIQNKSNCPVFVHNDAVMGAYGEAYCGLDAHEDFMYLTWGTGLGGALVDWQDGKVSVYRPENRTLLYQVEEGIGGSYCEKHFGKPMGELSSVEWDWVIGNIIDGTKKLSQSGDWGKSTFILGGGITTKQLDRLQGLTEQTEVKIILSKLRDNSGLYGGLAVIKEREI